MTKICPNCQKEYDDEQMFCSLCGTRLIDKVVKTDPVLNLGDANAISGGIHIDQSTNITSNDVHYHITQERTLSEKEVDQESRKQYRNMVVELMQNGMITLSARTQLDELRISLGLDGQMASEIEAVVKREQIVKNVSKQPLPLLGKLALDSAIACVRENNPQGKGNIVRLASVCRTTTNEQVHFYYYMLMAAYKPQQCVEAYEQRREDSYWQAFWTSVAYRKLGKEAEAEDILNELPATWQELPETNVVINACVGLVQASQGDKRECRSTITDYLTQSSGEPSKLLEDLFHALLHWVEMEQEDAAQFDFYEDQFFSAVKPDQMEASSAYDVEMRQADEAYDRKDYETALGIWRKWAENKDSWAMVRMGSYYKFVAYDHQEALQWYLKAAELNDPVAQAMLGNMYADGEGVPQDHAEAFKWYLKAAQQGIREAQGLVAMAYEEGNGVEQDFVEAMRWYKKAAEQGDDKAQCLLGLMYYEGRLPQDYSAAFNWFLKAVEQDNDLAQYYLGEMYYNGEGVAQNFPNALKWIRKSAEQDNDSAQARLGTMYADGDGVPQDDAEAVKWLLKAAEKDNPDALFVLGVMYEEGRGVSQDASKAAELYRRAADMGHEGAIETLENLQQQKNAEEEGLKYIQIADQYYHGKGVPKDFAKAFDNYYEAVKLGCAYGMGYAQCMVGCMFEYGQGVKQDYAEAADCYQLAVEIGRSPYGNWRLGLLYEKGLGVSKDLQEAKNHFLAAINGGHKEAQADYDRVCNTLNRPKVKITGIDDWSGKIEFLGYKYRLLYSEDSYVQITHTIKSKNAPSFNYKNNDERYYLGPEGARKLSWNGLNINEYSSVNKKDAFGQVVFSGICIKTGELGIKESGTYVYEGNISVYDLQNNSALIDSLNYTMTIEYTHHSLLKDKLSTNTQPI